MKKLKAPADVWALRKTELGKSLGVTKQAVSKMERAKKIEDDKMKQVASALGITEKGLRNFNQEAIQHSLYITILSEIEPHGVEKLNIIKIQKAIKFLQTLLEKEKEILDEKKRILSS